MYTLKTNSETSYTYREATKSGRYGHAYWRTE